MPSSNQPVVGVLVVIDAILPNGEHKIGSVTVQAIGECSLEAILDSAMGAVNAGLWGVGGRGTGPAQAQAAIVEKLVAGGWENPSLTVVC